jgi:hypothetical protein
MTRQKLKSEMTSDEVQNLYSFWGAAKLGDPPQEIFIDMDIASPPLVWKFNVDFSSWAMPSECRNRKTGIGANSPIEQAARYLGQSQAPSRKSPVAHLVACVKFIFQFVQY